MITVNCCALPDTLIESELFGHMKGAFTGAVKDQIGRFEAADGGTLFIDEIGELPINVQVKLLRFLQFRTIERIGENCERKLDIRIIAATNHDLEVNTQKGLFREDLYYRINVFPIKMPPLRHHLEDIPLLSQYFLQHFSDSDQPKKTLLSDQAMKLLCNYKWPGNVRELENAIEYALVRVPNGGEIGIADLPSSVRKVFLESSYNLDQSDNSKNGEAQKILSALNANSWHRENTAKSLGISRITLWKRMKKHGLTQ